MDRISGRNVLPSGKLQESWRKTRRKTCQKYLPEKPAAKAGVK
jgi:hypothetical protein